MNQTENKGARLFWFTGHETFPLRVSWLPKVVTAVSNGKDPFSNPREGMQILGLGKNMVLALQCWSEYFGVMSRQNNFWQVTELGDIIFGTNGRDPFLEDKRTLWILHWKGSTNSSRPFFGWHWLVNLCQEPEFSFSEAFKAFQTESEGYVKPLSQTTLRQHLEVFLRTYVASEYTVGRLPEDMLDSPLSTLGFIRKLGERRGDRGRDPLFAIDNWKKSSISNDLFRFCLHDWWDRFIGHEQTVLFSDVAFGFCGPGRVFRMPEGEIRDRLVLLGRQRPTEFLVLEGANQRMIRRLCQVNDLNDLISAAYEGTR